MKLTIVIEKVKDSTKKTKEAMFVIYEDKGKKVMAVSEIPKDSAFADELSIIKDGMKKLLKEQKKVVTKK